MSVTSVQFLLFALGVALLYNLALGLRWRLAADGLFLAANIYFLATFGAGGAMGFLPMAAFIAAGYAGTWLLRGQKSPAVFWVAIGLMIAFFCWLKKYAFVPAGTELARPYVTIGLSYMFFRIMQVLIDAHGEEGAHGIGIPAYLNYVLNFTTLISGPIQRYEDFAANRATPARLDWIAAGRSVERIVLGAFKVTVVAGIFYRWHGQGLLELDAGGPALDRGAILAMIVVCYTLYLYCNFSGYTDIVIGVARFLRIELPENFDRPFSALNFMDFWARWHMTLSNWLKFYVYNPLARGLMQRFHSPAADPYIGVFAFLVTFFLIGLWHGQTMVFVLYGLLLGVGVSGNKLYQIFMAKWLGRSGFRKLSGALLYRACARGLTFTYFTLSLVCFWAGWTQITDLCGRAGVVGIAAATAIVFVAATILLQAWEWLRARAMSVTLAGRPVTSSRYLRTAEVTAIALITLAVMSLTATPAPDIVYKNF